MFSGGNPMHALLVIFFLIFSQNLFAHVKVLAFAGSTREDSYNKKLIQEAANIASSMDAEVTVIDLKDFPMPLYDADLEKRSGLPENAKKLRNLMLQSSVIFIASPEYNHSIPAVLKNALDWASRGEDGKSSKAAFQGKKIAIMSASPGKNGGRKGLVHLRDVIEDMRGDLVQPQVSVANAAQAFNERGQLTSDALKIELTQEIEHSLN
jgi:chromate reductase